MELHGIDLPVEIPEDTSTVYLLHLAMLCMKTLYVHLATPDSTHLACT